MTTIEDAVRDTLAARAEDAPMRLDGRDVLDRVARREGIRRRGRTQAAVAVAAAAAVGVVVAAGTAWGPRPAFVRTEAGSTPSATPTLHERSTPATSPTSRTFRWNRLQFAVPLNWTVHDTQEVWPHPLGALQQGPYVGTLPTGPMCSTNECSRSHGIRDRHPVDGVVAWIDAAPVVPGMPATDPGPDAEACPAGATTMHVYRLVDTTAGRIRVAVDGCAYGPRATTYLKQIQAFAVSVQEA